MVWLVDLPSTPPEAAELPIPYSFKSQSLSRFVFDDDWRRDAVLGGWNIDNERTVAIRWREWKLLRWPDGTQELYNMTEGLEVTNLHEHQSDVVTHLDDGLEDHLQLPAAKNDETVERSQVSVDMMGRLRRLGYDE